MFQTVRSLFLTGIVAAFLVLFALNTNGFGDSVEYAIAKCFVFVVIAYFVSQGRQALEILLSWFGY